MKNLLFTLFILSAFTGQAQEVEKRDSIQVLLKLTGAGAMGMQMVDQMIMQFKQSIPDVPHEFWDEFRSMVDPKEMTDLIVPIYDRHFTLEDILELIDFYRSPIGQKFVSRQSVIMQESMAAGQQWGQEIGRKVMERLEMEGYK